MKRKSLILSAPVTGFMAGIAAWFLYSPTFEIVASPVSKMVMTFDQEVLRYRIFAVAAFFLLGFLVPIAAGMIGGFRADRRFGGTLSLVGAVAFIMVLISAWWLHYELSVVAKLASSFEAEDPSIPNAVGYSMIPLYRLATVPAIILVVAGAIGWCSKLIRGLAITRGQQVEAPNRRSSPS